MQFCLTVPVHLPCPPRHAVPPTPLPRAPPCPSTRPPSSQLAFETYSQLVSAAEAGAQAHEDGRASLDVSALRVGGRKLAGSCCPGMSAPELLPAFGLVSDLTLWPLPWSGL